MQLGQFVVPLLGCSNSKEILPTDCSLTCSDPAVLCLPVVKEDKIEEQVSEYREFSISGEISKLMC